MIKLTITINEEANSDKDSQYPVLFGTTVETLTHKTELGRRYNENDAMTDALNYAKQEWGRGDFGKLFRTPDQLPLDVTSLAPRAYRITGRGLGIVDVHLNNEGKPVVDHSTAGDNTMRIVDEFVSREMAY